MFRPFLKNTSVASRIRLNALDAMGVFAPADLKADYDNRDRRADFAAVFENTPQGRRVLRQILDRCRACGRSYVPGDTHETARREGARDIGLWMLEILSEPGSERPAHAETERPDPAAGR